ncbi:MAG: 2-amino-4-hydroxy-6-hydroxymethyldihydropteridine diphosphokinase [Fimbriimonadales bacterium]
MIAYLGLGSNLGDRLANLQQALNRLDLRAGEVTKVSSVYESDPMYVEDQPAFLNAVVELQTDFEPSDLLRVVKEIETECGRLRRDRYGPREVDIDLVVMTTDSGEIIKVDLEHLVLPHPRLCERRFVVEPLSETAPTLHVCGGLTTQLATHALQEQSCVRLTNAILSIHSD